MPDKVHKTRTIYVDFGEINLLQREIMMFVDDWVRSEKTPVPQKQIISGMTRLYKTKTFTTINALNALIRKGYIRRACVISNKTFYVQLRRV